MKFRPLLDSNKQTRTIEQWEEKRLQIKAEWLALLGNPSFNREAYDRKATLIDTIETPYGQAEWWSQPVGSGYSQRVILIHPDEKGNRFPEYKQLTRNHKIPGAVLPFYHPETVAGLEIDEENQKLKISEDKTNSYEVRCYGRHLAKQGYAVACVEAFPFNMIPKACAGEGMDWWRLAAEKLLAENPQWTGLGKLVEDTSRGLDLLLERYPIDAGKIVAMGHSLGGKRVFYTGALDDRIQAVIASDFGLPWNSTNWEKPWYLGGKIPAPETGITQHEILALLAPRPFFLIAGNTDHEESWEYLEAAREVYHLYDSQNEKLLTGVNHATGHDPTQASLDQAYHWLAERFELPRREWRTI